MNNEGIGKARISIDAIGTKRFWSSLIVGLLAAISLSYFFLYSRECLRFITGNEGDLLVLSSQDHWFWNYFYAALAVTLGLSISIWGWLSNRKDFRTRDRRYKSFGRTIIMVNLWFVLYAVSRFGSILPWLQGMHGYDNHLDLSREFGIVLVLIPLMTFLLNWSSVRLVYQSLKWMGYSAIICAVLSIGIAHVVNVDQEPRNNSYFSSYSEYFDFIESEASRAKNEYHIKFNADVIPTMKKRYTESSNNQLQSLKESIESEQPITMDKIILEGMAIRTMKGVKWYSDPDESIEDWQFASPFTIYNQLSNFNPTDNETRELIELIKKQIELWNFDSERIEVGNRRSEVDWWFYARSRMPMIAVDQLQIIRDSLMNDGRYTELSKQLPELVRLSRDSN